MKRKDIKKTIMEHFFMHPNAKLRVREIERILKLPLPSVIKYCRELEKEGILVRESLGNVTFYTASRSEQYLLEKKLYNIRSMYASGLVQYLKKELSNPPVILFGSYSKGEDNEDSDIDLYVESPSRKTMALGAFESKLKRHIQIFRHTGICEVKNTHLANNIINGIPLNNQVEAFS
jgi:predicted nucleotidyltransferase